MPSKGLYAVHENHIWFLLKVAKLRYVREPHSNPRAGIAWPFHNKQRKVSTFSRSVLLGQWLPM